MSLLPDTALATEDDYPVVTPLSSFEATTSADPAPDIRFPTSAAGCMGTVRDHRMRLDEASWRNLLACGPGRGIDAESIRVAVAERTTVICASDGRMHHLPGIPEDPRWGGNTHNAFRAMERVADAHGLQDRLHFIAHYSDGLDRSLRAELGISDKGRSCGATIELLDAKNGFAARMNVVVRGPNGADPFYIKLYPTAIEAPPLPDAPEVFVSSYSCDRTGVDVWQRCRDYWGRNPGGRILLSPASIQIAHGIPRDILSRLYLLSCNREEARKILLGLGVLPYRETPESLIQVFHDLGVQEVRITDGANGVYTADSKGAFYATPLIPRDHPALMKLIRRYLLDAEELKFMQENPDFNGCGDSGLGADLAARAIGIFDSPQKATLFSALVGAVQTYNSHPHIGRFSDPLIYALIGLTEQVYENPSLLAGGSVEPEWV